MSSPLGREEFYRYMDAKFAGLPCHEHSESLKTHAYRLEGIDDKAASAHEEAVLAQQQADAAEQRALDAADLARGKLWKLAIAGFATFCGGLGLHLKNISETLANVVHNAPRSH